MSVFENIVIGKSAVPSLTITIILMIAIPVCFFICWRRKHKEQTKISWLIAGTAGFVISARMLEVGVHYFCIVADNPVSRFINGNTAAFVLYGITMAGIFEECGRLIILKYILKKDRTRENAVIYGIGHGGIEILTVFLPAMILYLAIAVMFSQGDTETALKTLNISEETAAAALPSVQAAAAFDYAMMAMNDGHERHGAAAGDVNTYRTYGHRILRCCQCKEALPVRGHSAAYAGRYLSGAVSERNSASVGS